MGRAKEFTVAGVRFNERTGCPLVILKDTANGKAMAIGLSKMNVLGTLAALDEEFLGERHSRPFAHDFALALAEAGGLQVERVVVDRLTKEGVFTAAVEVRSNEGGEVVRLDARPSDAIPLALGAGAPIFVGVDVAAKVDFYTVEAFPWREVRRGDFLP